MTNQDSQISYFAHLIGVQQLKDNQTVKLSSILRGVIVFRASFTGMSQQLPKCQRMFIPTPVTLRESNNKVVGRMQVITISISVLLLPAGDPKKNRNEMKGDKKSNSKSSVYYLRFL